MTETVVQMPLHVVLFRVQMNHARFKSLAVSGFSGHKKTKQEIDSLYQSPVPDLVPVARFERVRPRGQGILSPRCLPFHHTGMRKYFITRPGGCQGKRDRRSRSLQAVDKVSIA